MVRQWAAPSFRKILDVPLEVQWTQNGVQSKDVDTEVITIDDIILLYQILCRRIYKFVIQNG